MGTEEQVPAFGSLHSTGAGRPPGDTQVKQKSVEQGSSMCNEKTEAKILLPGLQWYIIKAWCVSKCAL